MTNTIAPAGARAFLNAGDDMPLGGLALSLAEAKGHGIPDAQYVGALERILSPPAVDVGVAFSTPIGGGHPRDLELLLLSESGWRGTPWLLWLQRCGILAEDQCAHQLVHLLPILDLPAADRPWCYEEHVAQLLRRLTDGDIPFENLDPLLARQRRRLTPALPYTFRKAYEPLGIARLLSFFAAYPQLAVHLSAELPWEAIGARRVVAADVANRAAQDLLGIEVDLRAGRLVPAAAVAFAIECAAGGVRHACDRTQVERLTRFAGALVPVVDRRKTGWAPGLPGAAWSCMVDAVLSAPFLWSANDQGEATWPRDLPGAVTSKNGRTVLPVDSIRRALRHGSEPSAA